MILMFDHNFYGEMPCSSLIHGEGLGSGLNFKCQTMLILLLILGNGWVWEREMMQEWRRGRNGNWKLWLVYTINKNLK